MMERLDERVSNMTSRSFLLRLLAVLLVLDLFVIGFASWTIQRQYELQHEQAEVTTQNLVLALESELTGQIDAAGLALFTVQDELYRLRAAGKVNTRVFNAYIEKMRAHVPGIDGIRITDAQGVLIYGTGVNAAAKVSLADRPHFIKLRDDASAGWVMSKPQISRISKEAVIALTRRVERADGTFDGMLMAPIPLTQLTRILSQMDVGAHGVVSMRDNELAFVVRFPELLKSQALGSKNATPELQRLVQAGQTSGTYRTSATTDKLERTNSFRRVADYPYYLVVGRASVDYLVNARLDAERIIGLVVVFVLVTMLLAGVIYRSWQRQRKLNQSLAESEARLNELFENMSSGVAVYRVSEDGQRFVFSELNRAAERFENFRREDLIGKNVLDVFPGIVELGLLEVFKRVWKSGVAERFPLSFYHDGRISGWRDNFVYKLPGGEIVAIYDDVTERMQAQQALEELNRDFVIMLESTPDFIYFKDKDSRIRFCSQSMALISGHQSWRAMVGKHDLEIFPAETAKIYYEEELPIFRDGVPLLNKTDPYLDEHGNRGWVNTSKWPVFDADGKTVIGLFGISRDITARVRAEETVQVSLARLSEAQRIAKVGNWELDLISGQLHWSSEIFRMFEIDPAKFAATYEAFLNAIHPDDREAVNQAYTHSLETRKPYEITHRLLMADGSIKWVSEHCETIYDAQGKAIRSTGTVQDVTERQQIEDALRRSNTDLERFAYSVSHDMRQPLRAVSGHLQLLQRSLSNKLDEDERENMNFALEGARRMDSMIVSLLDYSRIGRKTEAKQKVASRAVLDEALGFLAPLIADTKAEISLSGDWPEVFASRDELTRLLQNLIGNAIKFREDSQSARVEIDSSVQGEIWHVSVRDHGVGIDPQQIDRLFQFFSRLQARTRFEGTGMGLALCRRIVEHHNGRIWVESEGEGKGSNFMFELPIMQESRQ